MTKKQDPLEALRKAERGLMTAILYKHRWFTSDGTCHCGWIDKSGLHAEHQTDMLREAGVGVKK